MNQNKLIGAGLALGLLALLLSQRASAASPGLPFAADRPDDELEYQPTEQGTETEPGYSGPIDDYLNYADEYPTYTGNEIMQNDMNTAVDLDTLRQGNEPGAISSAINIAFQPSYNFDPMQSPNVIAFLDMIAYAEGAGYTTLFGGDNFVGFDDHPRKVISKSGYTSSAAGRYQFLRKTWDDVAPKIGATSFDPYWQDRAAVYLIKRKGALADVIAGRFAAAINKVRKIWASLPGAGYGQPERDYEKLLSVYLAAGGTVETV